MNFNEAMQMLGTKLQGKYGHLGFKYKKSDKTLTRHSKNFTYMIAFSSFGGNTKDSISIEVCYIINTRPYDPYGYAKPDINTQPLFYSLRDVFVKRKCEQKGPKKVSTFSTRFHVVSNVFPKYQMLTF